MRFPLTVTLNTHFKAFQVHLIYYINKNIVLNSQLLVLRSMTQKVQDQKSCLTNHPKTVGEARAHKNLPSNECQDVIHVIQRGMIQSPKVEINFSPGPSNNINDLIFDQKLNQAELGVHKDLVQEQRQKQSGIQERLGRIKHHKRQNGIQESQKTLFPQKEVWSLGYSQSAVFLEEGLHISSYRFSALENNEDSTIASHKRFNLMQETRFLEILDSQIMEYVGYQKFIDQLLSNHNQDQNPPDFQIEQISQDIQEELQNIKFYEQLRIYLEQINKDQ